MANRPGKRQRHPLFDLPKARANYQRACQLSRFTVDEGASLLVGLDPEGVTPDDIGKHPEHKKCKDFLWFRKVLQRALRPEEIDAGIDPVKLVKDDTFTKSPRADLQLLNLEDVHHRFCDQ